MVKRAKKTGNDKFSNFLVSSGLKLLTPIQQVFLLVKKLSSIKIVRLGIVIFFIILFVLVGLFFWLRPTPAKDINYGVTFSTKYASEIGLNWRDAYLKILDDLGAKNLRLIVYWDIAEPENDSFSYNDISWQLSEADKRDANVILVLGRKVPRFPECFEPDWWKSISNENVKEMELLNHVKTTVSNLKHYKSIKMWQVENEPFFPFGKCPILKKSMVEKEVELVKSLDSRPILIQDSGEGGFWFPSYKLGDYLAISMYRRIWYDFWHVLGGNFVYFQYPLQSWTYKIKADITRVPYQKIIVTELQAEPWGPGLTTKLTNEEKDKSMSKQDFIETISYAQKTGFRDLYFWGVEWWLWEKEQNNNPFFWDTAKALFNQ